MRFFKLGGFIVAEKVRTGQRYSLRPWQYEILTRFNGKRSFEEAAREVYRSRPGAFTAVGLLNFYHWLYTEDLVLCECESIFELVLNDSGADPESEGAEPGRPALSEFAGRLLRDSRTHRALAVCAALVFLLSVIRLVQVAAPVFEPPVKRLYAEAGRVLVPSAPVLSVTASERSAAEPTIEKVAFAARAVSTEDIPADPAPEEEAPPDHDPGEPVMVSPMAPEPPAAPGPLRDDLEWIEALRAQLEACRIRRDEFYLQNDEVGYRREVHRMTNLAKEIGDIENGR